MGRPLNKKYFGNRNVGSTSTTTDDGIGGEGIYSYTPGAEKGSLIINSDFAQPVLVIPEPTIPGGVPATASVVWEIESIVVSNGTDGHDYSNGAFTLNGLTGSNTAITLTITATGSGVHEPQGFAYAARGEWTTIPTTDTTYQIVQAGSNGLAQANVKFRVKRIETGVTGSGYTGTEELSWNDFESHSGTMPDAPTFTLTTDSGNVGSATNQENAIIIHANTMGEGALVGDITKQVSTRRYKVKTTDGVAVCKLVDNDSPARFEAYIMATDVLGSTYFVTKLTGHKATLSPWTNGGSGFKWPAGAAIPWTFESASNTNVQIENA